MANGRGGARNGAGRKSKALAEKQLNGNPGHEPLKKLKQPEPANLNGEDMPPVAEYLKRTTKNTIEKLAPQIFENTWRWLKERGCENFVVKELIEQYALYLARTIQCEEGVDTFGLLAKHPTTGAPIASPYTSMGIAYSKQANIYWGQIFQIAKENSSVPAGDQNPNDKLMEKLLKGKG